MRALGGLKIDLKEQLEIVAETDDPWGRRAPFVAPSTGLPRAAWGASCETGRGEVLVTVQLGISA